MASTVWKGQLNFGFISMPVKFTTATAEKTVTFNQLHKSDKSRVKQVLHCQLEDKPIPRNEIVKGYEYEKDQYVELSDAELKTLEPETAERMEVLEFVKASEVDAIFFERSYHLAPEAGGERAYALLYATMRKMGLLALTKIAMHQREHVALLRPAARGIVLQTLYYHDEVRAINEFRTDSGLVKPAEVAMASELASKMITAWQPEKYSDNYREKLAELVRQKVTGETPADAPKKARKSAAVVDIAEALKLSLKARKMKRHGRA